ncbi:addiction module protein [Desulfatibacillum aliphaticivorans]|uniref:addiction module protein n=1 Tax=Desulfatibacillum aliphaticivorans TaxID=218208 RepID=UPI00040875D1|nr:addiction module protein [Desulfatibacillum aliphaticivorans]
MDKSLAEQILALEPAERMRLLDIIHRSLEKPDAKIDDLWFDEAEKRLQAYKAGKVKGVPADKVLGP